MKKRSESVRRLFSLIMCMLLVFVNGASASAEEYGYFKKADIEIIPVFSIPSSGYEGQSFCISDTSSYSLDGRHISRDEAYDNGYVSVGFSVLEDIDASIKKNGGRKYERTVTIHGPGRYTLVMVLHTVNGEDIELRRYINIDPTPDVHISLSGPAKERRLQYINIRNAQDPAHPVREMTLTVEDPVSGEKAGACLVKDGRECHDTDSSSHIKLRSPQLAYSEDGYFVNAGIELMSTFEHEKDLLFEVLAADDRGEECRSSERLHVSPDEKPHAAIDIPRTFLRDEGCSYASITAEDMSSSDGDALRRDWYIRYEGQDDYRPLEAEEGYKDLSDGDRSRVTFRKYGTGFFTLKLRVTDIWTEGTMEEYSEGSVVLFDETECTCEVTNAAPVVSAGPTALRKARVFILDPADGSEGDSRSLENDFFREFISSGIDAGVDTAVIDPSAAGQDDGILSTSFQYERQYGYRGPETSFENDLYIVDDTCVFMIDAAWADPDRGLPQGPFTILCLRAGDGKEMWSSQIQADGFSLDIRNAHMYQDDSRRFLYIVSSGKTLLVSKNTGSQVRVLEAETGEYNFACGDRIYTYRPDGIYSIDLTDGSVHRIWTGRLRGCAGRSGGFIVTYSRTEPGSIMKLVLDPENASVQSEYTGKMETGLVKRPSEKSMGDPLMEVLGIDSEGRAVLELCMPLSAEGLSTSVSRYSSVIQVYSPDDKLLRQFTHSSAYRSRTVPVRDDKGRFTYIAVSQDGNDSVSVEVYSINDTVSMSAHASDRNGEPALYDNVIYSYEHGGKIYVTLGAFCAWIYGQGWANGPSHGYPERCLSFCFDPATAASSKAPVPEGCTSFSEYSRSSDRFIVVQTARNSQYSGQACINDQVVSRSQRMGTMILNHMSKYLGKRDDSDLGIFVIDGKLLESSVSVSEAGRIADLARERGYSIYVKGSGGGVTVPGSECIQDRDYIKQIAQLYRSDRSPGSWKSATRVSSENGGRISKGFELEKDRRYSYQFTVRADSLPDDLVRIGNGTERVLKGEEYGENAWYVVGSESEDFDDSIANSFFDYSAFTVNGGMYTDCMAVRSASSNAGCDKKSIISFEVPEDRQAVLSFDYLIFNNSDAGRYNANYALIDGVRWETGPVANGKGSYTHPEILGPGRHSLELYCGAYGGKLLMYTCIDDLKVAYITDSPGPPQTDEGPYIIREGNDTYKITGSFVTPGRASVYREMCGLSFISGLSGQVSCTGLVMNENQHILNIQIPAGKVAVSPVVTLESYCRSGYNVNYTMSSFGTCTRYGTVRSFSQQLSAVSDSEAYHFPTLTGKHVCSSSYSSYRGSSGSFGHFEMFLADRTNKLIEEHRYIKAKGSDEKNIFAGEDGYSGLTMIDILLPASCSEISDFSLTTNEDGKRLYIARNEFSDIKSLGGWQTEDLVLEHSMSGNMDQEDGIGVFSKGQFIDYGINYWDHEGDPSGGSFWKYTHIPMNDGEFEDAAVILDAEGNVTGGSDIVLNAPVTRFYKDGRYIVEHWQTDDITRGGTMEGDPGYNMESNHIFITFYIGGIADAPWIRYIRTLPDLLREGDPLVLEVGVDDAGGSVLSLDTELYLDDRLVYRGSRSDISPSGASYPPVIINDISDESPGGLYTAVCTVKSDKGSSMESFSFRVFAGGNIEGTVYHTEEWDMKRRQTGREDKVFWPGERIMLAAEIEGNAEYVAAYIEGEEEIYYLTQADDGIWRGNIWERDMMYRWGSMPVDKRVIFEASYGNDQVKQTYSDIVIDNSSMYWMIHRAA